MHSAGVGKPRQERVHQVKARDASIFDFGSYVPIGSAVELLGKWRKQGAEIVYLSSHKDAKDVEQDELVLNRYNFPNGMVCFREGSETYEDKVEKELPDVLIEDDCESIGGEVEIVYPQLKIKLRSKIVSIVVKEFSGIDHLPGKHQLLADYNT